MHVDHPRTCLDGGGDGLCDRVRDVVKLQVEEDACPPADELTDQLGAFEREQSAADLEASGGAFEEAGELERAPARVDIQCD